MRERIVRLLGEINEDLIEDFERDLFETEILDSYDIIKLVMELEDVFDITIGVEMVTAEGFQTTEKIIKMVESLLQGC